MNETVLKIISGASFVFYISSLIAFLFKRERLSHIFWIVAILFNVSIIINNFAVNGYVPFVSMYQVLTFLSATFSLVYIYVRYLHSGKFMKPYFIALPALIMLGVTMMTGGPEWSFPPALQSVFFIPHVLSYMIGYSLTAIGALISLVNIFKKDDEYSLGAYNLAITAFPFMLSGMFLGALWANECWGEYWQWDAKENWSLLSLLMICIYFHFRKNQKLKKYSPIFLIISFVFIIITMFFVGMISSTSVHSYN